jgi:chromosome segregation protein
MEREFREKELEQLNVNNELSNLQGQREEISGRREKWNNEIRNIDEELARSQDVTGNIEAEIERLKAEEAESERRAGAAMERHEKEKAALEELNEEVTKMRLEAGAAESEKSGGDEMLRRIRDGVSALRLDQEARRAELADVIQREEELLSDGFDAEALLAEKEAERAELEQSLAAVQEGRARASGQADDIARQKEALDSGLEGAQGKKYEAEIRQAKNDTQLEAFKDRLWEEFEISYIQAIEFKKKEFAMSAALRESREIKARMKELGEVNVGAIREYESVSERYQFLTEQRQDLLDAMDALRKIIEDMDKTIKENFKNNFNKVVENFSETFRLLFGGGDQRGRRRGPGAVGGGQLRSVQPAGRQPTGGAAGLAHAERGGGDRAPGRRGGGARGARLGGFGAGGPCRAARGPLRHLGHQHAADPRHEGHPRGRQEARV